ncbi:MAG: LPS assembly lipoprotein LptE [Pseudomonadota bacterium]|nr:LPS assembly lipoprotein LptE [Pseudomonadota bacterium]
MKKQMQRNSSFPRRRESRVVALLTVIVMLAGCGFTLRGTVDLPPELNTLQIESPVPNSELVREVSRMLRNNAVTLTENANDGVWRLGIGAEQVSERVLSVNANARAGEYELTMDVAAQLRRGAEVIGPETLSVSRVYLADPENAVAKNEEAELIRDEMRRELAQQVLRRLQSLEL